MAAYIPTGHHASTLSSPCAPSRPRRPPPLQRRNPHAVSPSRRRNTDSFVSRVANCEPPSTLDDSRDDPALETARLPDPPTPTPVPKDVTIPVTPSPSLSNRFEGALSRSAVCMTSLAAGLLFLFVSFGFVEALTEKQMGIMATIAFLWSWGNRINAVRQKPSVISFLQLGLRLTLIWVIITGRIFQFRTVIFQHEKGIFPICALVTVLTVVGHFVLRLEKNSVPHDLEKPSFESLAPFMTEDVTAIQRVERRMAMAWLFFSSVCVAPFLHELLYRGVIAQSLKIPGVAAIAVVIGAVAYNTSQPFRSIWQQLAMLYTGLVWGAIYFMTDCNLMYPFVAHLMHNAFLFAVYHYKSITECL